MSTLISWGLSGGTRKGSACQGRRLRFDPWVRKISRRRKWQPTPLFLLGEFHGQRSLEGYSPWGHNESDMTEHTQAIQTIIVSYSLGIFVIFRISFQFAAVPRVICQKNFFPLCSLSNNDKMICQQAPA